MRTTTTALLSMCLLAACSSQNGTDKNGATKESVKPETTLQAETSAGFRHAKLSYPGSDITFEVEVDGDNLIIRPSGLTAVNEVLKHDVTGYTVTNAEIGDLNIDGYPEVFVYLTSDGSGSYGKLIGYSTNNGKSVSQVSLPDIADNEQISKGYMGHDEMAIVESTFCRRFPVYKDGDSNANPTGGMRQIQYKLVDGEACRILQVDKVVEF